MKSVINLISAAVAMWLTASAGLACGSGPHPNLVIPHPSPHASLIGAGAYQGPGATTVAGFALAAGLFSVALVRRVCQTESSSRRQGRGSSWFILAGD